MKLLRTEYDYEALNLDRVTSARWNQGKMHDGMYWVYFKVDYEARFDPKLSMDATEFRNFLEDYCPGEFERLLEKGYVQL